MRRRMIIALALSALSMTSGGLARSVSKTGEEVLASVREGAVADAKKGQRDDRQTLSAIYRTEADAASVSMRDVISTYDGAYDAALQAIPWWKKLPPEAGWLTAVGLLIALLSKEILQTWVTALAKAITGAIYNRFAGSRLFRSNALKKYRDALGDKYEHIFLPFRPDEPLEMQDVYVPLKVKGSSGAELVDASPVLAKHRRVMILGAPGSGKSMLFRNIAFSYSRRSRADLFASVPVLLELNRLNEGSLTLVEHIVEIFKLSGFPRAGAFVDAALGDGRLILLLDGFDEVNTLKRDTVVIAIKDFIDQYEAATVAITCRTQVYKDQFAGTADITLEVVEFNDHQINQYLQAWQHHMPAGKSIEQLLQTLRRTPNIMALARNPLLLTIVAFLYTRPNFVLPQSRTQFYSEAVKALFAPKAGVSYSFEESDKKLVLQHLALVNQERGATNAQDRRSVDRGTVLREVGKVLRDLNQEEREAAAIVDEIVARTGLILAIDGGTAYQFAHLTLQEYFAAKALQPFPEQLLEKFRNDPDTWRETAKLYCGLDHDSTRFLQSLRALSPITAFESLADAQQVDVEIANALIEEFKGQFVEEGTLSENMVRAFAAVASDQRPRGKATLDFLTHVLKGKDSGRALVAASAIAATNRPDAAEILTERYLDGGSEFGASLLQMGDLAVASLAEAAQGGLAQAVVDLGAIGTPLAALALNDVMWGRRDDISVAAGVQLATLLGRGGVELALRSTPAFLWPGTDEHQWQWVRKPFEASDQGSFGRVMSRIVALVNESVIERELLPTHVIDRRVAVPVAIVFASGAAAARRAGWGLKVLEWSERDYELAEVGIDPTLLRSWARMADVVRWARERVTFDDVRVTQVIAAAWMAAGEPFLGRLMRSVNAPVAVELTARLLNDPVPERQDWENLFNPVSFTISRSPHYWFTLVVLLVFSVAAVFEIVPAVALAPSWVAWRVGFAAAAALCIVGTWHRMIYGFSNIDPKLFNHRMLLVVGVALFFPFWYIVGGLKWLTTKKREKDDVPDWDDIGWTLPLWGFAPAIIYYASAFVCRWHAVWHAVVGWIVLAGLFAGLWIVGIRRDRLARNPLSGVLDRAEAKPDLTAHGLVLGVVRPETGATR